MFHLSLTKGIIKHPLSISQTIPVMLWIVYDSISGLANNIILFIFLAWQLKQKYNEENAFPVTEILFIQSQMTYFSLVLCIFLIKNKNLAELSLEIPLEQYYLYYI